MSILFNEQSKLYPFLKKGYFPNSIFFCKVEQYLKTIENLEGGFVIASRSAYSTNTACFRGLLGIEEKDIFFQSGEPTQDDLKRCEEQLRRRQAPSFIFCFGGGSAIDVAKAIKRKAKIPLIVVPTTPGTGAEVTPFSVFVDENYTKTAISSHELLPEVVILDPKLLKTIPHEKLGFMVVDMLAHSLEGLLSRFSNQLSDSFATQALQLIFTSLSDARRPTDIFFEKLQVAGLFGGMTQSMASVGLAHALAHYFGPRGHLAHGEALAIFLRDVFVLNMEHSKVEKKLLPPLTLTMIMENIDFALQAFHINNDVISVDKDFNLAQCIAHIKKDVCTMTNPFRPTDEQLELLIRAHVIPNYT